MPEVIPTWWHRIWRAAVLSFLTLSSAGGVIKADDPKPVAVLTDAQKEKLKERDQLEKQANDLVNQMKFREAISLVKKGLELEIAVHGREHDEVLGSLEALRWLGMSCNEFDTARKAAREAIDIQAKRFGPKHWKVTDARLDLDVVDFYERCTPEERSKYSATITKWNEAESLIERKESDSAIRLLKDVASEMKGHVGNKHSTYAAIVYKLANQLLEKGELAEADTFSRESLAIRRETFGNAHPLLSASLNLQGLIHFRRHEYQEAAPLFREAFNVMKAASGEDHPDCVTYLKSLAQTLQERGDFMKQLEVLNEARNLTERTCGRNSLQYAAALNEMAMVLNDAGDFVRAEPLYREALAIARNSKEDKAQENVSTYVHNLARQHMALGDHETAQALFTEALEVIRNSIGVNDDRYATCLSNQSILAFHRHDLEKAESLCREAWTIRKGLHGEDCNECVASMNVLAAIQDRRGNFAEAEKTYRQLIETARRLSGELHPELPSYRNNLAMTLRSRGKHSEAVTLFQNALQDWERRFGAESPSVSLAATNMAVSLAATGKVDEAVRLARQAAQRQRQSVERLAVIQSDRQQLATARQYRDSLDTLISLLALTKNSLPEDYDEVLHVKGRVWHRQFESRAMANASAMDADAAKLVAELRQLSVKQATMTLKPTADKDATQHFRLLAQTTERIEAIERTLSEKSADVRAANQFIATADIRRSLPENGVLIDFIEYSRTVVAKSEPFITDEQNFAAFVIRPDLNSVAFVDLGNAGPISEAIDSWRKLFGKSKPVDQAAAEQAGRQLRSLIWEPLEPHLAGREMVLVSPDGALGKLPFGAIPGKKEGSYLIEDLAIASLPCAMALPQMVSHAAATARPEVPKDLLVVANIDYDAKDDVPTTTPKKPGRLFAAVRGLDQMKFRPLAGSLGEMAAIDKLYRDVVGPEGSNGITLLDGAVASESRFRTEASRHALLHVATHGFFAPPSLKSQLNESATRSRSLGSTLEGGFIATGYPPGLLSGLAFAGANNASADGKDDGILTAAEVENLDLRGVRLAVLSACETGLGEAAGGEGLLGLQRSFQIAGTQSVVASLWEVPDLATRSLMERFYSNLLNKKNGEGKPIASKIQALRDAQLWMLREGDIRGLVRIDEPSPPAKPSSTKVPPFFWAAFVLSGDWR